MVVSIVESYDALCRIAAETVLEEWQKRPQLVLGLATGATPVGFYRYLVDRYQRDRLDFSGITTFNLDEYYPIARSHEQSFYSYMQQQLFQHVAIPEQQIHLLDGQTRDVEAECASYERMIQAAGGIDIQILGIGRNGHIGFNEPGTPFGSVTHQVTLTESTIEANAPFFPDREQVPRHALTMGIQTIMRSRRIILLATGESKAGAIHKALYGPVTEDVPASVLQLHPNVTVLADQAAASLI